MSARWRLGLGALAAVAVQMSPVALGRLAAQISLAGHAGVEARVFAGAPQTDEQPRWLSTSVALQPELTVPLGERVAFRAIVLGRVDRSDPERTYADLREALLQWERGPLTVSAGVNTVFWGVTESRHLANVVNQTDYLDDLDGDEKFGQLMALVMYDRRGSGIFELYGMTWARAQRFPGPEGRPGVPVPVLYESTVYESDLEQWHPDVAARWSLGVREVDWALSYFQGTAREPELIPSVGPDGPALRPRYALIRQGGLELQWTHGSWLWKGEGIVRSGQGPTFAAATGGFEHTSFGVFGGVLDLGTLLEYSYDGRDNLTYNIYDGDVFAGLRLSFNDVGFTEVLAGVLQDVDSGVTLGSLEASRTLGAGWSAELVVRVFRAETREDPVYWFRRDDYLQGVLEYHF